MKYYSNSGKFYSILKLLPEIFLKVTKNGMIKSKVLFLVKEVKRRSIPLEWVFLDIVLKK